MQNISPFFIAQILRLIHQNQRRWPNLTFADIGMEILKDKGTAKGEAAQLAEDFTSQVKKK